MLDVLTSSLASQLLQVLRCFLSYGTGAGSGSLVTRNSPHNPEVLP
jgi:hypothetical protein